ncbi:EAL domain-containing protein [Nocardioides iriomotensis]|uniref:EAL domain-containing protein n=1 Tax=Nocardioides iriomotensis TaxID=715784 RepID=A0A4Q5IV70_9ACTN|nr:EAL domain-containing protein [Nocardioides iriomotensis]
MWGLNERASELALGLSSATCLALFVLAVTHPAPSDSLVAGGIVVFTLLVVGIAWVARIGLLERATVQALRRQSEATAATSGGWVYAIDPEGTFVYVSEASVDFIGYEPHELVGRDARTLLTPTDAPHVDTRVGDVPQHVSVTVVRGRHRDGRDLWFEVTVAPVFAGDGRSVVGFGGTARLVTDEKHPAVVRELHRRGAAELLLTEDLTVAFQPIVELVSGRVVGVEALSRFRSRPGVGPDVVFAEAWNAGLGLELELLAVRRSLEEARLLDPGLYVAVNVSPSVLANPALTDALKACGLDLRRVVIEVTEHASVTDYSILERPRQRLRDLGVRLAIDDAGAGYSSLRHIVSLSPDIIKIDRALVADVDKDRARRALVMAVVVYALEIGTTMVVAEGVETRAEMTTLMSLGVDAAQGYLTGRPTTSHADWFGWRAESPAVVAPEVPGR